MPYVINSRLRSYLNFDSIKVFLRNQGVPSSGAKTEILNRIEQFLNKGKLPYSTWEEFVSHELKNGHNRSIYRVRLNKASLTKLSTVDRLKEALTSAGYPNSKFSDIVNSFPDSEEPELVYFNYTSAGNDVLKVEMGFSSLFWTNKVLDENEIIQVDETDYVWVEIDTESELLTMSFRPRGNTNESSGRIYYLYEMYTTLLTDIFSLRYLTNDDFKSVLYNVFRELTSKAEKPYVQKVEPLLPEIEAICNKFAKTIGLPNSTDPVNLPTRFKRLLERALIQNDFFNFKAYKEGKIGTVEKFHYADDTGARVNASANEGDGIELSDIYFDTRDTIDDQRKFNKLWVTFFLPEGYEAKQTEVRLEANSKYYLIHFFRYLTGGEKDHVLSQIETFRRVQD